MSFAESSNVILVVMGVSGSGKTTIGELLASALGWTFLDADDFHSAEAIEKMRQSIALTEAERQPWVDAIVARLNRDPSGCIVLACSALTHAIRERLRTETHAPVQFVYLKLDPAKLRERLEQRQGHYAKAGLLQSQLATLEEPQDAVTVIAQGKPEEVCQKVLAQLQA